MCILKTMEIFSILLVNGFLSSVVYACTTPLGETSDCVSLYNCPTLLSAFEQRPLPSSVVTFLRQSQCGFDGYVPQVCCGPLPQQQARPTTSRPVTTRRPLVSSDSVDPDSHEDSSPSPSSECGIDTNGDRIYGGQFTDLDEFPWMALLGYRTRNNVLSYQCGGVLLNHRYVLTAAHCTTGAVERDVGKLSSVRLGEYDIQTDVDCTSDNECAEAPQEIPVQSAHPHPGFVDGQVNRQDDIALVRLAKRVNYNYYVRPICLVDDKARLTVGNDVYVAGWGKTLNGKNSPIKLKLRLPIFNKNECVKKYSTLRAQLTEKQICAGGVFAEDACRGDSGGPLMRRRPEGVWEVVAVVSFGYGCGRDGWPGVYTSIASYTDWLRSTMSSTNNN